MKTIENLVSEHELFRELTPTQHQLIAGCGRNRVFRGGEFLMREGDPANDFFAIREGQVALAIHLPGRGDRTLETLGAGEVVGWSWLFPPYRVEFDVRAVGLAHTIAFDGACLRGKCDADPTLGYALMKRFAGVLIAHLHSTRLQLLDLYANPT